ncbi:MAG: sigma-70 family RNA polymerase sigma factor [Gemmatimonadaceae bacterium]|nr:sigma-70 family RNA polymerase sigma factor [Gemmatimonadaceae bacterium]
MHGVDRTIPFRIDPVSQTSSDADLIARAVAGDEVAMRALWAEHAPRIDAVVRRLVRDADEAADIAQEVWIQIFRALPGFRGDAQFSTLAHRIAVNRTLNALRRARRLVGVAEELEEDTVHVEDDVDQPFLRASLEQAVHKLPPGARTVFVLHDVEGYTHEEIAAQLGITTGGSKSQLFKARAKLRALLAPLLDLSPDDGHVFPVA